MDKKLKILIFVIAIFVILTTVALMLNNARYNRYRISSIYGTEFPDQYIKDSRGKVIVEIPKVYELLNIVISLSNIDNEHSPLTNTKTEYYRDVLNRFIKYKNHPIVKEIKDANEKLGYSHVRNLFIYSFNNNSIVHGGVYSNEFLQGRYEKYIKGLQDFAKISEFEKFYNDNKNLYQKEIQTFVDTVPVKKMWHWLETNFSVEYDTYKIIMSPLTAGAHNTFTYRDKNSNYSEIVMFISSPVIIDTNRYTSKKVIEGLLSQMVFTEIDHNYVNPTTNRYKNIKNVVKVFSDVSKWNKSPGYVRPVLTFNEYMTWATFLLYADDTYLNPALEKIKDSTIKTMSNYRGFVRFEWFYNQLFNLYNNPKKDVTVEELYTDILNRCNDYQ